MVRPLSFVAGLAACASTANLAAGSVYWSLQQEFIARVFAHPQSARRADCSNEDCPHVRAREMVKISASAGSDDFAADVAAGGCGHASAVNHVHARAASFADLRDHAVGLMNRRE
jgi:hypothetical protein